MKTTQILIAGFGGQGILFAGKFLAYKGLLEDLQVSWLPSYGPEMRGGTANCSVVISSGPIGSPVFAASTELIALNEPSLEKFEAGVQPGGAVFVNSGVVTGRVRREDLTACYVPCSQIAEEVGNPKAGNMAMLGAYVGRTGFLNPESIEAMIAHMFAGSKAALIPLNIEAFRRGMACVR